MTSIILQAATESALADLLLTSGVVVASETGYSPATGIIYSNVGQATLPDGTRLQGYYAFIGIDDVLLGEAATSALLSTVSSSMYTGPDIRALLGVSNYNPSIPDKINNLRDRKMKNGGCKTTGSNWYSTNPEYALLYASWVALGDLIVDANVKVIQLDGSQQTVTKQLALDILKSYVNTMDMYRTRARLAVVNYTANPATFRMSDIIWPASYSG